jgi:hypothetical protein
MIVAANAEPSRGSIDSLIELYGSLRQAWQQAERKLQGSEPPAPEPPGPSTRKIEDKRMLVPVGAPDVGEAPRKNWSA